MHDDPHRDVGDSPLGRRVEAPDRPDARILFPVARALARGEIGLDVRTLPFIGMDIWNAYELSWLDARGKPRVAIAELRVPADSPNLIESKSLKLYLNGYAQSRYNTAADLREAIARDLVAVAGAPVQVALIEPQAFPKQTIEELAGISLDEQELDFHDYGSPQPDLLCTDVRAREVEESLATQLFRSHCPVTGQPDWAAVQIRYRGAPIDYAGLLRYLVSYRGHRGFHEACVERIFADVLSHCAPRVLFVHARFTRRGGLDINPWRSTPGHAIPPCNARTARQ